MIAEVVVDILNKQVNRSYDYIIPQSLENIVMIGSRVYVPFGNLKRMGFVVGIKNESDFKSKVREIIDIVDVKRILDEEAVEIAKHIADNNFSFYATALGAMIPTALKIKYQKVARVIDKSILPDEAKAIFTRNEIIIDNLDDEKRKIVYEQYKNGNVALDTKMKKTKDTSLVEFVTVVDETITPTSKRSNELFEFLLEYNEDIELSILVNDCGYSKNVIKTLESTGAIKIYQKQLQRQKEELITDYKPISLNDAQKNVFDSIKLNESKTYLIHGVTGSGKTLIYMELIEKVINENKQAILLVPEISLTPQITSLFKARFKTNVAIIHSRLTIKEKYEEYKKIINQEVKIVIGARSAIFAPMNNIGVIIIDEAHESSYRQQNNPKYDTKEIARIRCNTHNCPLILGSATPDVVDYYYATNGEYELLTLPQRANNKPLPKCEVVDMRYELENGNRSVLSENLRKSLIDCYKKHEQSILFLNRRGHSSFVMCRSCGKTVECPNCNVSLTYHQSTNSLKCHHCGYQMPNVSKCSSCNSDKIRYVGTGTEKIMDAVKQLIPEAKVLRADMDTTTKKQDYDDIYNTFKNHDADILVGTQMITKGLDFKDVTLVGVVNADLALNYPLYDASMVAYNLIEQVSGRCGRADKDGKVIIQTYNPEHYVIKCAKDHNYDSFYVSEIKKRQVSSMPPFSSLVELVISSKDASMAFDEANKIVAQLKRASKSSIILGPAEALIFKKNNIFSFTVQVIVNEDSVYEQIRFIYPIYQNNKDVSISITRM